MTDAAPFLPSAEQRLLIEALLKPDAEARDAAQAWLDRIVFDDLDLGSRRLLPLFHKRLPDLGIAHPLEGRIRGIYRRAWYVDRQYRHLLDMILQQLAAAQMSVILLKGAGLGLTVYPGPTFRPFEDLDLMVPHDRLDEAAALLTALGFAEVYASRYSKAMRKADHPDVDLHRSPFKEAFMPHHVAPLWARSRPLRSDAPGVRVLGAEDELLHIFAHGLRPNVLPPIRWVIDAAFLLRAARSAFDWALFANEAGRLEMVEESIVGLRYLRSINEPGIDDATLEHLAAGSRLSSRHRFRLECAHPGGPFGLWLKTRRNARGIGRVALFLRLYSEIWGVSRPLPFIRHAFGRLLRRVHVGRTKSRPKPMSVGR